MPVDLTSAAADPERYRRPSVIRPDRHVTGPPASPWPLPLVLVVVARRNHVQPAGSVPLC